MGTSAVTMRITTADAIGTAVTAVAKASTSTSLAIAKSVYVKNRHYWTHNVQGTENVVLLLSWAIDVVMMQTTTVDVIGTVVIAAEILETNSNSRTAVHV